MNWLRTRLRAWEWAALALATLLLFRPDALWDRLFPEFDARPAAEVFRVAGELPDERLLVMRIAGTTLEGEDVVKTVALSLPDRTGEGDAAAIGRRRLSQAGLTLTPLGDQVQVAAVRFGSRARRQGIEQGFEVREVLVPADRPSVHWPYLPAVLLAGLVWWSQGRRMRMPPGSTPGVRGVRAGAAR
jgi:hypothetical protein